MRWIGPLLLVGTGTSDHGIQKCIRIRMNIYLDANQQKISTHRPLQKTAWTRLGKRHISLHVQLYVIRSGAHSSAGTPLTKLASTHHQSVRQSRLGRAKGMGDTTDGNGQKGTTDAVVGEGDKSDEKESVSRWEETKTRTKTLIFSLVPL